MDKYYKKGPKFSLIYCWHSVGGLGRGGKEVMEAIRTRLKEKKTKEHCKKLVGV